MYQANRIFHAIHDDLLRPIVPKVHRASYMMAAVAYLIIPLYAMYLLVWFAGVSGESLGVLFFLPSLIMVMHCYTEYIMVVPFIEFIFSKRVTLHRRLPKWIMKGSIFFINRGQNYVLYGAISFILTPVCLISTYWDFDPTGFTKAAADGFLMVLLTEVSWKSEIHFGNVICTLFAMGICWAAMLIENKDTSITERLRDIARGAARFGMRSITSGATRDEDAEAAEEV